MTTADQTLDASAQALDRLAAGLTAEKTLLSPLVVTPQGDSALGELAAAGPSCSHAPAEYALVIETIREGYLLHYAHPRVLSCDDPDLALLAGDYLYAQGLERLSRLDNLQAVTDLANLISLSAQLHASPRGGAGWSRPGARGPQLDRPDPNRTSPAPDREPPRPSSDPPPWLATVTKIGWGTATPPTDLLNKAAKSIGFPPPGSPSDDLDHG